MAKEVKQSLVYRTGMALAAVLLLAVINMLVSFLIAESSENDAVRINLAGSLRMQSYRIATSVVLEQAAKPSSDYLYSAEEEMIELSDRLHRPVLNQYIRSSDHSELKGVFNTIEMKWERLIPELQAPTRDVNALLISINDFVASVDLLVKKLELQTEQRFRLLRTVQGVSLLLAVVIVSIVFYQTYWRVVTPLRRLVDMASKVREGDFSVRVESESDDELSLLAQTLNDMVTSLDEMYANLEHRVTEKTLHLEKIQQGLRLLYDASRQMMTEEKLYDQLDVAVREARNYLGIELVEVQLLQEGDDEPYVTSAFQKYGNEVGERYMEQRDLHRSNFPLIRGEDNYGVLTLASSPKLELDEEQLSVVLALVDTIVSAISYGKRHHQQHRLALMEERAAIARELHDSLAQSLSYTKIQIGRFQILQKQGAETEALDSALDEIRIGIQSAYGQLREILATFRLQLNTPGLLSSLNLTIKEFAEKGDIPIELSYELKNDCLTPNQEIHVLQIIRESLSNVIRHSHAQHAWVALWLNDDGEVQVNISDDGCGFAEMSTGPNHYGKTIMSERASVLKGSIAFIDRTGGGALVDVRFEPLK